jgi:hypothetical protein
LQFAAWLREEGIAYEDISGSAENLMRRYESSELHVGYRVHAHIFMSSISKPSILLAEDGRGTALREVIGGLIFNGINWKQSLPKSKEAHKSLSLRLRDAFVPPPANLPKLSTKPSVPKQQAKDLRIALEHEMAHGFPRLAITRACIDAHFATMKQFLLAMP